MINLISISKPVLLLKYVLKTEANYSFKFSNKNKNINIYILLINLFKKIKKRVKSKLINIKNIIIKLIYIFFKVS